MAICQNCKTEYGANEVICPKCNCENISLENKWVHLTTVSNEIEFSILVEMLKKGNISILRKPSGVDQFVSLQGAGIEIMVPRGKYHEAMRLLDAQAEEEYYHEEERNTELG
jgi:RNA polymerase subunit RPABC4/transcription elongation factor Spt4